MKTRQTRQPKRFYAQARSRGSLELKEIAKILSQHSSVSAPDVVAVLTGLIELVPEKLMEGYQVRLGNFGTFRIGLSSVGEETAAQVKPRSISKLRVKFRPGKEIREKLRKATFEKN